MDHGTAATHLGMVHQVVVEERVVVVGLEGESGGQCALHVIAIKAVAHQCQHGADAFAAAIEDVGYRLVKAHGLRGIRHLPEGLFNHC